MKICEKIFSFSVCHIEQVYDLTHVRDYIDLFHFRKKTGISSYNQDKKELMENPLKEIIKRLTETLTESDAHNPSELHREICAAFPEITVKYLYNRRDMSVVRFLLKVKKVTQEDCAPGRIWKLFCNGLIFSVDHNMQAKLLVVPTAKLITANWQLVASRVEAAPTKQKIINGTIFNLYHFSGSWRIGTSSGIDMGGVYWNKHLKFSNVLADSFPDFESKLDKKFCYSFVIAHPELNLVNLKTEIYFIQRYELKEGHDLAPPCEVTIPGIPPIPTVDAIRPVNDAIANFVKHRELNYGYIARYPTGESYQVASDLLKYLTENIYNTKGHDGNQMYKNIMNELLFPLQPTHGIFLRAILNARGFVDTFDDYIRDVKRRVKLIIKDKSFQYSDTPPGVIARNILVKYKDDTSPLYDGNVHSIVSTFVENPRYVESYYRDLFEDKTSGHGLHNHERSGQQRSSGAKLPRKQATVPKKKNPHKVTGRGSSAGI